MVDVRLAPHLDSVLTKLEHPVHESDLIKRHVQVNPEGFHCKRPVGQAENVRLMLSPPDDRVGIERCRTHAHCGRRLGKEGRRKHGLLGGKRRRPIA